MEKLKSNPNPWCFLRASTINTYNGLEEICLLFTDFTSPGNYNWLIRTLENAVECRNNWRPGICLDLMDHPQSFFLKFFLIPTKSSLSLFDYLFFSSSTPLPSSGLKWKTLFRQFCSWNCFATAEVDLFDTYLHFCFVCGGSNLKN